MAKDPAILWYWSDWQGGTSTFSRHLKGCYIDLLYSQFNSGRLSLAEIKTILGADFGPCWPTLQKKFKVDERGMYYNVRMEAEQARRKKYTESRRNNLKSNKQNPLMDDHVGDHMTHHMVNATENKTDTGLRKGGPEENHHSATVFFDVEKLMLENPIQFENICMSANILDRDHAKDELHKYHLHLESNGDYPRTKKQLLAGYEKWLLTGKKFANATHSTSPAGAIPKPAGGKSAGANTLAAMLREEARAAGQG